MNNKTKTLTQLVILQVFCTVLLSVIAVNHPENYKLGYLVTFLCIVTLVSSVLATMSSNRYKNIKQEQ